jgi:hypothetical protein
MWKGILKSPQKLAVLQMLRGLRCTCMYLCEVTQPGSSLLFLVLYLTGARFTVKVLYLSLTKNSQGKMKEQQSLLTDSMKEMQE